MYGQESDDRVGRLIATRYQPQKRLDAGAMGQVYLARDGRMNKDVALKFLNHALTNQAMCDRFLIEAQACAQLSTRSNHIVQVTDFGRDDQDGTPFLVMEYLQGSSLSTYLQIQRRTLPLLPPFPLFLRLIEQICLGLKCAHDGIEVFHTQQRHPVVHCDIKPSNLFITQNEHYEAWVKILDFGVAQILQDNPEAGAFMGGTPPYCSPEQSKGEPLDPRSDIYSLGIVMYEMLTCEHPLSPIENTPMAWLQAHCHQSPRRIEPLDRDVPQALQDLVMACLEKLPQHRPQTIAEILKVIKQLERSESSSATSSVRFAELTPQIQSEAPTAAIQVQPKRQPIPVFPPIPRSVICGPGVEPARMPALWAKLPHAQIQTIQIYQLYNKLYQKFLFSQPPEYPALLWITAIYNPQLRVRWFTCFVDLKTTAGGNLIYSLARTDAYQYLFCDAESPHWVSHQITRHLDEKQIKRIQDAALASQLPFVGSVQASRDRLKTEFNRLKPEIERRMISDEWSDVDN